MMVPLHADLRVELEGWSVTICFDGQGRIIQSRELQSRLDAPDEWYAPAGRIRQEGFTFHGLRASS